MARLSVDINKIVTLRNACRRNTSDVAEVALDCESLGTNGITVHPRPGEYHTRRSDAYDLRPLLRTEFNIEGYPPPEFTNLALKVKPHQVTLVSDDPSQITSNSGQDTKANQELLTEILDQFNSAGIRTSAFMAADPEIVEYAAKARADRIELYTEPYAADYPKNPEAAIAPFIEAVKTVRKLGTGLNVGHDLSLMNLNYFYRNILWANEVSTGYTLASSALYLGLEHTIREYKSCLHS